jgi:hypothetical protein
VGGVRGTRDTTAASDLPPGTKQGMWSPISSPLIYGERDAVLVDAFITVEQADALVDWVEASGKNLTTKDVGGGEPSKKGDAWIFNPRQIVGLDRPKDPILDYSGRPWFFPFQPDARARAAVGTRKELSSPARGRNGRYSFRSVDRVSSYSGGRSPNPCGLYYQLHYQ